MSVLTLSAALAAGGCGGEAAQTPDAETVEWTVEELSEALPEEFEDTVRGEGEDETGVYAELPSVQRIEELSSSVELDEPQCVNATHQWNEIPGVREAPSALATYGREGETITHTLVTVSPETAEKVMGLRLPEECRSYEAAVEDGADATFQVAEMDTSDVAGESYGITAEAARADERLRMHSLAYRASGYLGITSLVGEQVNEETLLEFVEAARERETRMLG